MSTVPTGGEHEAAPTGAGNQAWWNNPWKMGLIGCVLLVALQWRLGNLDWALKDFPQLSSTSISGSKAVLSAEAYEKQAVACAKQLLQKSAADPSRVSIRSYTVLGSHHPHYLLRLYFAAPNSFGAMAFGYALCCVTLGDDGTFSFDPEWGIQVLNSEYDCSQILGLFKVKSGWNKKTQAKSAPEAMPDSKPQAPEPNRYFNREEGLSYVPPEGWVQDSRAHWASLVAPAWKPPSDSAVFSVGKEADSMPLAQYVQVSFSNVRKQGNEFTTSSGESFVTSQGREGIRVTVYNPSRERCRSVYCFLAVGDNKYTLALSSTESTWQENEKLFDATMKSVRFE